MEKKSNDELIIKLLIANEKTVADLYKRFSTKYENKEFWNRISKDELNHAAWLKDLSEYMNNENVFFDQNRFSKEAIESFSFYVEKRAEEARNKKVNLVEALSRALDIEEGLIERDFFKSFESDLPVVKNILNKIQKETRGHAEKVRAELNKQK